MRACVRCSYFLRHKRVYVPTIGLHTITNRSFVLAYALSTNVAYMHMHDILEITKDLRSHRTRSTIADKFITVELTEKMQLFLVQVACSLN